MEIGDTIVINKFGKRGECVIRATEETISVLNELEEMVKKGKIGIFIRTPTLLEIQYLKYVESKLGFSGAELSGIESWRVYSEIYN